MTEKEAGALLVAELGPNIPKEWAPAIVHIAKWMTDVERRLEKLEAPRRGIFGGGLI